MPKMGYGQFDIVRINAGGGHYFLLPSLTSTQRDALTAENGMMIYQSTTGRIETYEASGWKVIGQVYGDATFLKLAGGTMTGAIAMGTNKITGMGDPSAAQDAATKTYTDTAIDTDVATHAADYNLHNKVVYKSSNQIVSSSATLENDTALLDALVANEKCTFMFVLWGISNAAADWQFNVTGPSGATGQYHLLMENQNTSRALGTGQSRAATGSDESIIIIGTIVNSTTAGNLQLQWCQGSSHGSNTTIYAGSYLVRIKSA